MQKTLSGQKIAFLVANGFCEQDLVLAQKQVQALGAETQVVSVDQGFVSSWNNGGWGLNFAADSALRETLAVDYTGVVVPGGRGSVDKLQMTAHTRRFLKGLYDAGKLVCLIGEAKNLLSFAELDSAEIESDSMQDAAQAYGNLLLVKDGIHHDGGEVSLSGFVQDILLAQVDAQAA